MEGPVIWENEERIPSPSEKLIQKSKEMPYVPIGIAGTLATLAYGAYAYRFRGAMSTSRYLMRLRVVAQGMAVGSMIIGALFASNLKK